MSVATHTDPVASVILGVTCIFFFAIIGRYVARRFDQPGVLGELLMGVLVRGRRISRRRLWPRRRRRSQARGPR